MARGPAPSLYALFAACAACAVTSAASPASAEERPEPIRIVFSAPPECPSVRVFEQELHDRTRHPWVVAGPTSARTLRITITSSEGLYRGRLIIEDPSGAARSDEVPWEHCDDIVSALAVKAAMAVDGSPPRPMPILGPEAPAYPPAEEPRWTFRPSLLRIDDRPQPWRLTVGANLIGTGAISSGLTPAAALYIDVSRIGEGLDATTIRISLLRAIDDFEVNEDIVTMQWIASRLEVCPLHRHFPPFTLLPCMAIDTGVAEWKLDQPGVARHWVAVDLLGRAQLTLFERLILEAQAGIILPLTLFEFGLGEDSLSGKTLHRVPVISGMIGAGTGIRFP